MTKATTALLLTVLLLGCATQPASDEPKAAADAKPAAPVQDPNLGSISGQIDFTGTVPSPDVIGTAGFPGCAPPGQTRITSEPVSVRDGKLANVFVYIKLGLEGKTFDTPQEPVIFDQKNCMFTPRVLGVQKSQPFTIRNSDPMLHNIHALPNKNTEFNFGLPVAGMKKTVQFDQEEVMVKVKCDVHAWMSGWVGVLNHPFYATTGLDGRFNLMNVPAGKYTVETWHELLGPKIQEITVGEKESVTLNFAYAGK